MRVCVFHTHFHNKYTTFMASSRWLHGVRCRFLGKTLPVAVQYRLSTATMHTIFRSSFSSRDERKPEQKNWENNFYRRENLASACVCDILNWFPSPAGLVPEPSISICSVCWCIFVAEQTFCPYF